MAKPDNPFFAKALVNRLWGHFLGRGLVHEVDDLRETNPPSNPELLDALAKDFVTNKFDVKHIIRTIVTSRVYQLSSRADRAQQARPPELRPLLRPAADGRSVPRRRRSGVRHEDAASAACGTNARAVDLPHEGFRFVLPRHVRPPAARDRAASANGRPGATLAQVLLLANSRRDREQDRRRRRPGGEAGQGEEAAGGGDRGTVPGGALGRPPTDAEKSKTMHMCDDQRTSEALEDVLWSCCNTKSSCSTDKCSCWRS